MEVTEVPTSELAGMASPYNPRKISDHDLGALRRSLKFFDVVEPIVVNRRSGHIVGGHQRVKAAEAEGIAALPVVYVDLDDPSEKQLNLALNRISGEWDLDKLAVVLADLNAAGADLSLTGFSDAEIAKLVEGLDQPVDGLCDPDAVPEPPDEPATQPGDLIVLGEHRLLCGDSANPADVARLLDGAPIHLVNTDPPYNVRVEPRSNNAIAAGLNTKGNVPNEQRKRVKAKTHHQQLDLARHPEKAKPTGKMRAKDRPLENDFVSDAEFARLLRAWFKNLADALEPGRSFYLWGGYSNFRNYPAAIQAAGLYFSQAIVWDKQWPVLTRKDFMGAHEWCQPAGTQVLTPEGPVGIETLRDGDRVVSYSRHHLQTIGKRCGESIATTSRQYNGNLLGIAVGDKTTWCTPKHLWTVRLSDAAAGMWCTYLMRKGDWWRVGKSMLISSWGFGLKQRLYTEGGEEAWVLGLYGSSVEAAIDEQVILAKYGIPTFTWSERHYRNGLRQIDDLQRVYDRLDLERMREGALFLLRDYGRRLDCPIVTAIRDRVKVSRRVTTTVRACNVLPGAMVVPCPEATGVAVRWDLVRHVERQPFDGPVYSMEVEKFHHYVADGIVTHNCYYGWKEGAAHYFAPGINNATDLWRVKKVTPTDMVHLTEKPVELAELAMTYSSRKGENVLDLFGGSGSTLIAAERMGRRAFLAEIDPAYTDVIVTRWQNFTGKTAQGWRGNG